MTHEDLQRQYPWLRVRTTVEEYVAPDYYDRLLKDYVFEGKTDIEMFREFLQAAQTRSDSRVLELGCGPGRATAIAIAELVARVSSFQLVDLSGQMLAASRQRFADYPQLSYLQNDSVHHLEQTTDTYDLVFSLWSFSHSVHQILSARGLQEGTDYFEGVLRKFIITNLAPGARFFLIHFDSLSDEQRILMRQWKKVFPIFSNLDQQSPSEQLMSSVLNKLKGEGIIDFQRTHHLGDKIVYKDMNEALETFMNFHMESYFNDSPLLAVVMAELETYFRDYLTPSGTIEIRPGCFIYTIKRLA